MVFLGEDVAAPGGVFKATPGLLERFGPERVADTPISEQAILGAAMGAAMTGLRPIAEIMFSDFLAVCWDIVANEIAKTRYMTNGQVTLPLVIRTANGGGLRFGAQHSQSVENWAMAVPGPQGGRAVHVRPTWSGCWPPPYGTRTRWSSSSTRASTPSKEEVPDGELLDSLGTARVRRSGRDCTILALAAMVPRALRAAEELADQGIDAAVIDVRSLVPLDTRTILASAAATGQVFTVEENPRLCGWGAEVVSIIVEEVWSDLDGPPVRITTPHVPLPAADELEDHAIPSVARIVGTVSKVLG